jgi:RND family efflux transporter MFP subunit
VRHILALSALAILAAAGCGGGSTHAAGGARQTEPVAVTLGRAESTAIADTFEAGGVVRARATAIVASRVAAVVGSVRVRAGDRVRRGDLLVSLVRRGDLLVSLDAREVEASRARAAAAVLSAEESARAADADVRAAEAALGLARATHQRIASLHQRRSATAHELDGAAAAVAAGEAQTAAARARAAAANAARDAAAAALNSAEVASSYAQVTAPFAGTVAETHIDPGSMATPGAPLVTVEDWSSFHLELAIDEARAALLAVGQQAEVRLDEGDDTPEWRPARVVEVGRVDPRSHTFMVKVALPDGGGLRSGLYGRARFAGRPRSALTVPDAAVVRRGQLALVFVAEDGLARLRPVAVGERRGERREVLAGLAEGAVVVTAPPASLLDGTPLEGGAR